MAETKARTEPKPNSRIHNPGEFPLDPPGQGRIKIMATKKTPNMSRHSAKSKAKSGTTKKRSARRRHHNPAHRFGAGLLGGLKLKSLISAGGGALVVQLITNAIPLGAPGSILQIGEQLGLAVLVHKLCPRFLDKEAATYGAASAPVVQIVNKLVPNLSTTLQSWIPRLPGLAQPAGAAGLVVMPDGSYLNPGMNGLVAVNQDSPVYPYFN